jgi:hypothetical protein
MPPAAIHAYSRAFNAARIVSREQFGPRRTVYDFPRLALI